MVAVKFKRPSRPQDFQASACGSISMVDKRSRDIFSSDQPPNRQYYSAHGSANLESSPVGRLITDFTHHRYQGPLALNLLTYKKIYNTFVTYRYERIAITEQSGESMRNPFRYGGIVTGPYFADRKQEIEELRREIENINRVFLVSPRRLGKPACCTTS